MIVDVKVNGEHLGTFEAPSVPRIGERLSSPDDQPGDYRVYDVVWGPGLLYVTLHVLPLNVGHEDLK